MHTSLLQRLVSFALSLVLTLGIFQTIAVSAGPDYTHQLLVRAHTVAADPA